MPELPEVETVRRVVERQIKGASILSVEVINNHVIAYPDEGSFVSSLVGEKIDRMDRRGKFLSIVFDSQDRLFIHLRMTGCLIVAPPEYLREKHTHLVIGLSNGKELRYIDPRRFGRFWFIRKGEDSSITGVDKLGIEPFNLTPLFLKENYGKRNKPIKEMLLDQTIIAGIGNIYSDEILFSSCINPEERCKDLDDSDWIILSKKIPETMEWAIRENDISDADYLNGKGRDYRNTPFLSVYGREGEKCKRCSTILKKTVVGGRSSVYCPLCQKRKGK